MKTTIAYILVFLLAPTVGGLGSLLLLPLDIAISRASHPFLGSVTTGIVQGFLSAWFGRILLGWFGLKAGLAVLVVLGIGFLLNDLRRLLRRVDALEVGYPVGEVGGLVLAAIFVL